MNKDLDQVVLSEESIKSIIEKMAISISEDYRNMNLTMIPIMNGGLFMAVDLIRKLKVSCQIESLKVNSYFGKEQMEESKIFGAEFMARLDCRDVLIVDEIYDSGKTIDLVTMELKTNPKINSVRSAVLLNKNKKRETVYHPNYIGVDVANEFLVGYGLDYNGMYRDLPYVCCLKSK